MLRVKDPQASLAFYCEVLGFNLLMHKECPQWSFNVYFVAPVDPTSIPSDPKERRNFCMRTPGCVELTWNYGTEKEKGKVYNTGNSDATGTQDGQAVRGGFGHLGITVPDVYEACARFAELGCDFSKTPNSGSMKVRPPLGIVATWSPAAACSVPRRLKYNPPPPWYLSLKPPALEWRKAPSPRAWPYLGCHRQKALPLCASLPTAA